MIEIIIIALNIYQALTHKYQHFVGFQLIYRLINFYQLIIYKMERRTYPSTFLLLLAILSLASTQVVSQDKVYGSATNNIDPTPHIVKLTTVEDVLDLSTPTKILKSLGVPGFSSKHGYNYVALEGWSCQSNLALPLKIWQNPNTYLNNTISNSDKTSRDTLKNMFKAEGVKVLANAFSSL